MCGNPSKFHLPSLVPELVKCLYSFDQDVLSGWALRIPDRLDGSLVVGEDGAPAWAAGYGV